MQPWQSASPDGTPQGQRQPQQWQAGFGFPAQQNQYDPNQAWSQSVAAQPMYSNVSGQNGAGDVIFAQGNIGVPSGSLNGVPNVGQTGYHGGHPAAVGLGQQYPANAQPESYNPIFDQYADDVYGQQGKIALNQDYISVPQLQAHSNAHGGAASHDAFSYIPPDNQVFDPALTQYTQTQLLPQHMQQGSPPPQSAFDGLNPAFTHTPAQAFPQHTPSPSPNQQAYSRSPHSQNHAQLAAQQPRLFPNNSQHAFDQAQGSQYQHQHQHPQSGFVPQQSASYSQPPQESISPAYQQVSAVQTAPPQTKPAKTVKPAPPVKPVQPAQSAKPVPQIPATQVSATPIVKPEPLVKVSKAEPIQTPVPVPVPGQQTQSALSAPDASSAAEQAKKRKRVVKKPEPIPISDGDSEHADSPAPAQPAAKKVEEVDALIAPKAGNSDMLAIQKYNKRSQAEKARFPPMPSALYLISEGTTALPTPKSHDKLAPLVALPSRSGKLIMRPAYDLPCEVQGRFTTKYKPNPEPPGGLDQRRLEVKALLDSFDREMKALGRRRPKYTEYPHAFKEQLKADEALRTKAERKAKKELEEERNKPVRSETRPTDPIEAAAWDMIGIVFIDPNVSRTLALIAGAVQQAGEFFIGLRGEMNRLKQEIDASSTPKDELPQIKANYELKKEVLCKALDAASRYGDESVLENLGGNQKLVTSLVNMLITCIKAGDFSGKLPKAVLELMANFTMTEKVAENANFENVRKRLAAKGDEEVKQLLKEIVAGIKKDAKESKAAPAEEVKRLVAPVPSTTKLVKPAAKPVTDTSPPKRAREDEQDTRTVKKIAVEASGSLLSKKLGVIKPPVIGASKATTSLIKPGTTSILPGKTRPVAKPAARPEATKIEPPKPDAAKATPALPDVDKPAVSKAEVKKPSAVKPETAKPVSAKPDAGHSRSTASSSVLGGIASLLDSINAPKPEKPARTEDVKAAPDPSETPEQREKRLRKEARRKLRVSWKDDDELVQVRIFHKEAAEDEGRADNMTRDAADDRSEGMMLKQRLQITYDEEEDDDIPYRPWVEPTEIDFSTIPQEVRDKNYVTRGGSRTFSTDEQRNIAEREKRTLMAIYTDPNDIPPTPKSPPPESTAMDIDAKVGHLPMDRKFEEIHRRWKETRQYGADGALYYAVKRLEAKDDPASKVNSILDNVRAASVPQAAPSQDPSHTAGAAASQTVSRASIDEQVLAWLTSEKIRLWADPDAFEAGHVKPQLHVDYADPQLQIAARIVLGVSNYLKGLPYPATQPPEWLLGDAERVREWWAGYQRDRAKKEADERAQAEADAHALRAAVLAQSQPAATTQDAWAAYYAQQQQYAQYMGLLQQVQGGQQPPSNPALGAAPQAPQLADPQLQAILAAMQQPGRDQAPPPPPAAGQAPYLNPNDNTYQQLMMLQQLAQQNQPGGVEMDRDDSLSQDRDPQWDGNHERGRDKDKDSAQNKRKAKGGNGPQTLPPHQPVNRALIGTKACTFWAQGKCARGEKCTFRHD